MNLLLSNNYNLTKTIQGWQVTQFIVTGYKLQVKLNTSNLLQVTKVTELHNLVKSNYDKPNPDCIIHSTIPESNKTSPIKRTSHPHVLFQSYKRTTYQKPSAGDVLLT